MASLAPPAVPTPADAGSAASSAVAAGSGGAGAGAAAQAAKPDATASANGAPVSVSASSSLAAALMAPLKTGAGGGDAAGQPRSNGSDPADGDASAVGGRVDPSGSAALAGNSGSANGSTGSGAQTAGGDGAATASANGGGGSSNLKAHPSPEAAGASKPASSSAAGDGAAGLKVRTKSRGSTLNPAAAEFTPTGSPIRLSPARSATTFPASWAPPAAVIFNSGLRLPAGLTAASAVPAASPPVATAPAPAPSSTGSTGSKRRRKRRGRKRVASVDGDPTSVKLTGVGSLSDVPLLRDMVTQLFADVTNTAFTCDNSSGPGHLVGIISFASVDAAERAVKAGSVNYNGVRLKLSRPHGGGSGGSSAPTNVVRLSGVPLATTEESLAKLLAKHGARASAATMQQGPDGAFNGVVLCRYCSNDAAARAVSQLSKAVAEGKPLNAEYHLPPGTVLQRPAAAAAPKSGTPPPAPAQSHMKRVPANDFRHRLVPALPQSGPPRARRSRGYSEDWTSRRSSDSTKTRPYRKGSFAGSPSLPEGGVGELGNTWRERRARSLSGCGSAPPVPVHYARGPDGSVGFEVVRRGRSRSVAVPAAGMSAGAPGAGAGAAPPAATAVPAQVAAADPEPVSPLAWPEDDSAGAQVQA